MIDRIKIVYLSRRRKVESKQFAKMQLPSFDIDMQLTACPKLSDISLIKEKKGKQGVKSP